MLVAAIIMCVCTAIQNKLGTTVHALILGVLQVLYMSTL